jgi:hypothetical protein
MRVGDDLELLKHPRVFALADMFAIRYDTAVRPYLQGFIQG